MGATITWKPVKPGKALGIGARSRFLVAMREMYGEPPWILGAANVDFLRGLMAGLGESSIDELIDAIESHGDIEVCVS